MRPLAGCSRYCRRQAVKRIHTVTQIAVFADDHRKHECTVMTRTTRRHWATEQNGKSPFSYVHAHDGREGRVLDGARYAHRPRPILSHLPHVRRKFPCLRGSHFLSITEAPSASPPLFCVERCFAIVFKDVPFNPLRPLLVRRWLTCAFACG